MVLLDLPPEMFNMIIRQYVRNHGVRAAWKIRAVSRLFCDTVDFEVFARQPVSAFLRRNENDARNILKNKLGTHLAHRAVNIDNLFGAHDPLPKFLKVLLDWLRSIGVMRADQEFVFALLLANQLAFACESAWNLATQRSTSRACRLAHPNFVIDFGNEAVTEIAVAATVGHLEIVKYIAFLHGYHHLWLQSYGLGPPVAAAAGGNHWPVVKFFVAFLKLNQRTRPYLGYDLAFRNAIEVSLTRQHSEMTLFLLDVYHRHFPAVPDSIHTNWLDKALRHPDVRIYYATRALRTNSDLLRHMDLLKILCKDNNVPRLQLFFSNECLDPKQGYYQNKSLRDPLCVAVDAGNIEPVAAILEMGAHPDGGPTCRPDDRPLWRAVMKNKVDIVILLLVWGAAREPLVQQWNATTDGFKRQRVEILRHLRGGAAAYWNLPGSTVGGFAQL